MTTAANESPILRRIILQISLFAEHIPDHVILSIFEWMHCGICPRFDLHDLIDPIEHYHYFVT